MLGDVVKRLTGMTRVRDDVTAMKRYRAKYAQSAGSSVLDRVRRGWYMMRITRLDSRNGCFIPVGARLGEGISFPHGLTGIFLSSGAVIGKNCTIFQQVTVGSSTLPDSGRCGAPVIGDNVFIGAGAKIIGRCRVGNNVRIGANAVVTTDVPDNATVVMGKPVIITHDAPRENVFVPWQGGD